MNRSHKPASPIALVLLAAAACSGSAPGDSSDDSLRLTDDTGYELRLAQPARRIVSLVPAATEILFALGRGDRVVGRTRYDRHPRGVESVASVGDGIRPDPERVLARSPDLVIMFAGPDSRASIERLRELGMTVLAVRHNDLTDLRRNIRRLGLATGADPSADSLIRAIDIELADVAAEAAGLSRISVYYDLGGEPPYTIGAGSYLDSLLTIAGGVNIFADLPQPSAVVGLESIIGRRPDCIIAGTGETREQARLRLRRAPGWSALEPVRQDRIASIEPDAVHRLGPRVGAAAERLRAALDICRSANAVTQP